MVSALKQVSESKLPICTERKKMKTGLILVDIQNDYFAGGRMELAGMDAATWSRLIDLSRAIASICR